MLNTNYEDQGIQNATNLAQRLPDLGRPPTNSVYFIFDFFL
jgi:hypothetical protein